MDQKKILSYTFYSSIVGGRHTLKYRYLVISQLPPPHTIRVNGKYLFVELDRLEAEQAAVDAAEAAAAAAADSQMLAG